MVLDNKFRYILILDKYYALARYHLFCKHYKAELLAIKIITVNKV